LGEVKSPFDFAAPDLSERFELALAFELLLLFEPLNEQPVNSNNARQHTRTLRI
jgi:hypothetical protein